MKANIYIYIMYNHRTSIDSYNFCQSKSPKFNKSESRLTFAKRNFRTVRSTGALQHRVGAGAARAERPCRGGFVASAPRSAGGGHESMLGRAVRAVFLVQLWWTKMLEKTSVYGPKCWKTHH